ncbi:hypothetical protein ROJ8625_00002 [Roseivivax jejudonensis]|uniref:Uncharacterized protein n=1 Tax=Roseivivax jejudonensis TaxID=1529041 RepID=A0A1X6Y3B0_9RHOB|nr:hypothetical protein ROJ8625_00002 [Roseivivax jejudonensis]
MTEPHLTDEPNAYGKPFIAPARAETMLRDFDRLRQSIRSGDIKAAEKALDKCERWFSCIDPSKAGGA